MKAFIAISTFICAWVWIVHSGQIDNSKKVAVHDYALEEIKQILNTHTEKLEVIRGSQYEILRQIDSLKEK
jgi:hypothetical protein